MNTNEDLSIILEKSESTSKSLEKEIELLRQKCDFISLKSYGLVSLMKLNKENNEDDEFVIEI